MPRMEIRPTSMADPAPRALPTTDPPAHLTELAALLWGETSGARPLPPLGDLIGAAIALATARQRKCLLRLPGDPAELALVRWGDRVHVSGYETGAAPTVWLLDREVALDELLRQAVAAARASIEREPPSTEREVIARLASRAEEIAVVPDPHRAIKIHRRGGCIDDPGDRLPLAFSFEARIVPCPLGSESLAPARASSGRSALGVTAPLDPAPSSSRADLHALLFDGTLFVWARGRKIPLARGPIMLVAQRMVAAVRALVDADDDDRSAHVRLLAGSFHVAARLTADGSAALTLGSHPEASITVPALALRDAALPVLRLASDLVRALVSTDRSQGRNLRVRAFRDEVRALRRRVNARGRSFGFVNDDPDRIRAAVRAEIPDAPRTSLGRGAEGRLRFTERWRATVDELDAKSTFLCGDRVVVATPRRTIALGRDDGRVLWVREGNGGATCMVGRSLVRIGADGEIELCDVDDGETYAVSRIAPRMGAPIAISAGSTAAPLVVLAEGESRLSALDLRNGEPVWRYHGRGAGPIRATRVGRLLFVVTGEGILDAIDVTSGDIVWRFAERTRFVLAPAVTRDIVIAAGGEPGGRSGALFGIDLFTGELRFRRRISAPPAAAPVCAGSSVVVALGGRRGSLACFGPRHGELRWMVPDPGVGAGGACMSLDRSLLVNAPGGKLTAIDLDSGVTRFSQSLADPVADDVPRALDPILRGGALFVPAASVHVVRPADGSPLGAALPCDLVPDFVRVDERGWVYVAEESGHLAAYAPAPQLSLVSIDGGRG